MQNLQSSFTGLMLAMTAGLLGIVIWFLTSEKPHRIVAKLKYARNIFLASLLIMVVTEGRIILILMSTARKIQSAISTVAPEIDGNLKVSFYTYRTMSVEIASWYYGFHIVLYGVLVYLVWRSKRTTTLMAQEVAKKSSRKLSPENAQ